MDTILVVGATGQLGMAAVKELLARGCRVRALLRRPESVARFRELGAETAIGDLTDYASLAAACAGTTQIVATANAAVPTRAADTFAAVDGQGYRNLIRAAGQAGVRRFVYTSAPVSRYQDASPFLRCKREIEKLLEESGMDHVIFRADIFMDVSFVMMGSLLPLRGAEAATLGRPFGFAQSYLERIKNNIEEKGLATIPGDGRVRHAFVCVDDVARILAAAAVGGPSGTYTLGGPEALTFLDVVTIYEKVLGVKLRVRKTPKMVFWLAWKVLGLMNGAAANLMLLNYIACTEETLPSPATAEAFSVRLTSCETFLRRKAARAAGA